jgi:hypothetical protein
MRYRVLGGTGIEETRLRIVPACLSTGEAKALPVVRSGAAPGKCS